MNENDANKELKQYNGNPLPKRAYISFNEIEYHFHFYASSFGRIVALCNSVAIGSNVYGEGISWHGAMNDCFCKIMSAIDEKRET